MDLKINNNMVEVREENSPIYTSNFKIFDFDTSSIEKRYRVVSETCDIEINKNVKKLLDFIRTNEGQKYSFIIDKFSEGNIVNRKIMDDTLLMLFSKGILKNEKEEIKEIKEEDFHRNKMEHFGYRRKLIDTEKHENFFCFFSFVFSKPFVITILFLFFMFDAIFVYSYFFTSWKEQLTYFSAFDYLYLGIFGWVSLFLHETGHIAAAKKYNAKTGGIGLGIYYYMLVGYADIHETWNLPRQKRSVVSIAGFYWNMISTLPIYILCFYLSSKVIADFLLLFHFSFISVFNPFLKMDGYWFLSDTLGVPNLQNRIKQYFFQYLPAKYFNKLNVVNPFISYPVKTRKHINVYIVLFIMFMVTFLSLFLYKVVNIIIDFEVEIVKPLKIIITNWDSSMFNKLLRNGFILFGWIMFFQNYFKKIIKFLIQKISRKKI